MAAKIEAEAPTEIIGGRQLVVRMQYDDALVVSQGNLERLLSAIVKSMKDYSLLRYSVTLGARVNPGVSQDTSQPPSTSGASTDTPQACQTQSNCAAGGISAIGSSPAENYSYFAKTVLNTEGSSTQCSTILVEIFVNEKIETSDSSTRTHILDSVTKSIDSCIVKQQTDPTAVRICVLNFVSNPNEESKSAKK